MLFNRRRLPATLLVLGLLGWGFGGCSSSSSGESHSAGSTGTAASGGHGGGAGNTANTSGNGGTGGTSASSGGGGAGSGGASVSGGAGGSHSGGNTGTGGSSSTSSKDAGGSDSGSPDASVKTDAATGKDASPGHETGSGGSSAGDASGAGGSDAGSTVAEGSPGCGSANPLKTSNSLTETINGTQRKWMLDVPSNYDTNKPYRLIFVWHPLGGNGSQIVSGGFNGLKTLSNGTAIFATADGLNGSNSETSGVGWWNANGGDMKLVQAMLDKINAGLCVDQKRIFSTGFSFGGMMSYTLPFEFDVFRAVAPCSGKTGVIPYDDKYSDPVPIMAFHGDSDTFVATSLGKAFFDKFATRNKCGKDTKPVSPNGCVEYQGCVVPSIWCTFSGGHNTWSEEPAAIWKFFSQF